MKSKYLLFLETLTLLILIAYWVYLKSVYGLVPEIIPIHFDSAGNADGHGNKIFLFELPRLATIFYIILAFAVLLIYLSEKRESLASTVSKGSIGFSKTIYTISIIKFILVLVFMIISLMIMRQIKY
ncbi:MAG: DUF1648 domain-containing protein [Bacteroidota bacterium]